ncbi:MAG: hypothetical protein AB4426_15295 [Xenococcaceae cyanobacterium]
MSILNHQQVIATVILSLVSVIGQTSISAQPISGNIPVFSPKTESNSMSKFLSSKPSTLEGLTAQLPDFGDQRQDPTLRETRKLQEQLMQESDFFERSRELLEEEIRRFRQQQSPPMLSIDAGIQPWQPVIFRAGGFSIWIPPGILTEESRTVEATTGTLEFRVFAKHLSGSRFVAAYANFEEAQTDASEDVFAVVRNAVIERTAFELKEDRAIALNSYPGRELELSGERETIIFRVLLIEQRIYVLGVRQPTQGMNPEAATAFFNSFQLLELEEARQDN